MKVLFAAAALSGVTAVCAQSLEDLKNDGRNTDNILTYGMGYHQQRYSRLSQIDRKTVRRLVPVWNLSLDNNWEIGRAYVCSTLFPCTTLFRSRTYGMGYHQQRYSRLSQRARKTVRRLVPVWNLSLDNNW